MSKVKSLPRSCDETQEGHQDVRKLLCVHSRALDISKLAGHAQDGGSACFFEWIHGSFVRDYAAWVV